MACTRQDHLRGSITPEREWWDVLHYDLTLQVFPETKSLKGSNVIGCRVLIGNSGTIIGDYNLNSRGSGDMYYKGGNMLHTVRHMLNDDERWRSVLQGLNRSSWHKTVGTGEFEAYISQAAGFEYSQVFDQYPRTTDIPVIEYSVEGENPEVWWDNVVPGFSVPVLLRINGVERRVTVSEAPTKIELDALLELFELDRNF